MKGGDKINDIGHKEDTEGAEICASGNALWLCGVLFPADFH